MSVQIMGSCRIVEDYDEAADRTYAECEVHGWACSGDFHRVSDAIGQHYDTYNEKAIWDA